ncbi:translation initiation factor IF-2-like [Zalophus californianus]|uniref:Translation initiation factor IF-2-like n=1 Tax=Zalophus californianus TaxID=9704 RepID=A0A6J2EVX2_ZALCA|nr:translation initiation factor IF-2-like [Zalophus californianus]
MKATLVLYSEAPARPERPGSCRARHSASHRTPAPQLRVSPADAEGPAAAAQVRGLAGVGSRRAQVCAASPTRVPPDAPGPGPRPPTARRGGPRALGGRGAFGGTPDTPRTAAEASRPRVPSRRPRPDTQPQTCGLSRPGARLRAGKEAGRPGGAEGLGGGAAGQPATRREDREDQAAATGQQRSFARHPRNGQPGGVRGPEKGARRGGRAAAAAPIGPGSRPSARAPAPSRGAPPRLVRRRPEGSSAFPLAAPAPPPRSRGGHHGAHRPPTGSASVEPPRLLLAPQTNAGPRPEREVAAQGEEEPGSEEGSPQDTVEMTLWGLKDVPVSALAFLGLLTSGPPATVL